MIPMNTKDIDQLRALRQQIAVGYIEGLETLRSCQGDIEKAVAFLQEKYTAAVAAKTLLSAEIILPVLRKYQYDPQLTINSLEQRYRLINGIPRTETIFTLHHRRSDKTYAVKHIASEVERLHQMQRSHFSASHYTGWYTGAELGRLDTYHSCVVALTEWLDYRDDEGFDIAVGYHTALIAVQLEKIGLGPMAHALLFAGNIAAETKAKYPSPTVDDYIAGQNALHADEDYQHARAYFEARLDLVVRKLFDFIEQHADHFP